MDVKRFFRYLAPNLVTLASLIFGMMSIVSSVHGDWVNAGWFVVFSVLTDKLDGWVARWVKGTSEFGVQLDSFADFLNFGIAPATLWYSYLSQAGSPMAEGTPHVMVAVACVIWVLAVVFRLARYNIVGDDPKCRKIFFGIPTTLMGGTLVTLFLTFLKYGGEPALADDPRMLGSSFAVGEGVWKIWPALVVFGAAMMASTLRVPKLGLSKSRALTVFIFANVLCGYGFGATRHFPEYLCVIASIWIVTGVVWGLVAREMRGLKAPPIFPKVDPPPGREPQRPEEDQLPDEEEQAEPPHDDGVDPSHPAPRSARG
jgi:CDP-diacylglycerol---serine O-phosphatidyltransferase